MRCGFVRRWPPRLLVQRDTKLYVPDSTSNTAASPSIRTKRTPVDRLAGTPFSVTRSTLFAGTYTVAVAFAGIVTSSVNVAPSVRQLDSIFPRIELYDPFAHVSPPPGIGCSTKCSYPG